MASPTHEITIRKKQGKGYATVIGVGWENEFGISLVLNPGVTLSHRDCEDHYINIREAAELTKYKKEQQRVELELEKDDLPF